MVKVQSQNENLFQSFRADVPQESFPLSLDHPDRSDKYKSDVRDRFDDKQNKELGGKVRKGS